MKKNEKKRQKAGLGGGRTAPGRNRRAAVLLVTGVCLCLGGFLGVFPAFASSSVQIRYSEIFDKENELPEPDKFLTDEEGVQWRLKDSEVLLVPATGRSRMVSGEVVYPGVTAGARIPESAVMEVDDEESGQTISASLPMTGTEYEKERWNDDLEFTVTFHSYGADVYTFGGTTVSHQSEEPPLLECREELLKAIGMTEENCRMEEFLWAGEPYADEDGTLCRDALVRGSRRVWDCRAVYAGKVMLPDVTRYRRKMEYMREEEAETEGEGVRASAAEPPKDSGESGEESRKSLWQWLLRHGRTVSIGLFAVILAVLGFLLLKRRAETLDGKN